jgi:hypothetical protein
MLIVALAIVVIPLGWLANKRMQRVDPADRGALLGRWIIACLGVGLALRIGLAAPLPLRVALFVLAIGAFAIWLRRRGHGGGGGDDGDGSPEDPDRGPRPGHRVPLERLDPDAFDRARAEWEQAAGRHAPD